MTSWGHEARLARARRVMNEALTRTAKPHTTAVEQHADYPHLPGTLYDCPACEARCHCTPGATQCVYNGEHNGLADL